MRYLLIPGNNSLSHVAKCLAIRERLVQKHHEVLIAVARKNAKFLKAINIEHCVISDIQEIDGAALPTTTWFKQPQWAVECINTEVALLKKYKPDSVLGVFRFTTKASCRLAGIPYDSLICGCMLPGSQAALGYTEDEAGRDLQRQNLAGFYRYAGAKLSRALAAFGLNKIGDIRQMLRGDRTFLWDIPEFFALEEEENIVHVGPVYWDDWPQDDQPEIAACSYENPLAVLTFGTCSMSASAAERIAGLLLDLGYHVLIVAGGQEKLLKIMPQHPAVTSLNFAPLRKILPHSSLVICHGGQMTVFEALSNKIPVAIMPFQPEQAHNGVCLERLGCGCRLVPPQPFRQNPWIFTDALHAMHDEEIKSKISNLVDHPQTAMRLRRIKKVLDSYNGAETLAAKLEAV